MLLTKCIEASDFEDLQVELGLVDAYFACRSPQHPMRRWEYALALRAIGEWGVPGHLLDVGGAGSPFAAMIRSVICPATIVDPLGADPRDVATQAKTLGDYLQQEGILSDVVTCLSVVEHVPDLDGFLYHLGCCVAPGGLLILTTDYTVDEGPDTKALHWMRERIFTPSTWTNTVKLPLLGRDFDFFGGHNEGAPFPGNFVEPEGDGGYTFASCVLRKRA